MLKLLLTYDNINPSIDSNIALETLCKENLIKHITLILDHPNFRFDDLHVIIHKQLELKNENVLKIFTNHKCIIKANVDKILCYVCLYGYEPLVDKILEFLTVDLSFDNFAALRNAATNGHTKIVKKILTRCHFL